MKFRKKPVVIEAVQFNGNNGASLIAKFDYPASLTNTMDGFLHIRTPEGEITASMGDWIIKGVKNEFYPCKPDIFTATYEGIEE